MKNTVNEMKRLGIEFAPGMNDEVMERVEACYGFSIPSSLRSLYREGVPISGGEKVFPNWTDFGEDNAEKLRDLCRAPMQSLKMAVKQGYWASNWGERPEDPAQAEAQFDRMVEEAPRLMPLCPPRYLIVLEGEENPPVISAVGQDIIPYGIDLAAFLQIQFLEQEADHGAERAKAIPFWGAVISDLIRYGEIFRQKRQESGLFDENGHVREGVLKQRMTK